MATVNFSGIASGIDSSSLIKALIDQQRRARVNPLKDRIAAYEETNSAFDQLSSLLGKLQTAAAKFRSVNGGALEKVATSSNESVLTATASNSATNGTYSVTVAQLAKNATFSFASSSGTYTSESAVIDGGMAGAENVTIKVGRTATPDETVVLSVNNTTTLQGFVDAFNNASSYAEASIVNVKTAAGGNDYRIFIATNNTGIEDGQIDVTFAGPQLGPGGTRNILNSNTESDATDAQFTVSGITGTIYRSTNSVSDLISGVNLQLEATGAATLTIGDDPSSTTKTVQDFVDAYNDVVRFISDNDTITREEEGQKVENIFGPLASVSLDETILSSLRNSITAAAKSGGTVNSFADLGITTERDGTLKFDADVFEAALTSDPTSTRTITQDLGEDLAAVNGSIAQFVRFNGLIDQLVNSNSTEISSLELRIADIESTIAEREETLTARFSRLESVVGKLSAQQAALAGLVAQG